MGLRIPTMEMTQQPKIQEHDSNTTAIKAPSDKDYAYRLQVKVEGMDQQEVNVSSLANTASGISVAKGSAY